MFFEISLAGDATSEKVSRLIDSVHFRVLYATSRCMVKTCRHLIMGLTTKSITGSLKIIIDILNRKGHSISYPITEEYETRLADETNDEAA